MGLILLRQCKRKIMLTYLNNVIYYNIKKSNFQYLTTYIFYNVNIFTDVYLFCFMRCEQYTTYSNEILLGNISKLYKIQGTNTINAITMGRSIVQLNDIS